MFSALPHARLLKVITRRQCIPYSFFAYNRFALFVSIVYVVVSSSTSRFVSVFN